MTLAAELAKVLPSMPPKPKAKEALAMVQKTKKPTPLPSKAEAKLTKGNEAARAERDNAKSQAGMGRKGTSFAKAKARLMNAPQDQEN